MLRVSGGDVWGADSGLLAVSDFFFCEIVVL